MKALANQLKQAVAACVEKERREEEKKEGEDEEEEKEDDEVWCTVCFQVFASSQAAASHRNRAHGQPHVAWCYASSGGCDACGKQFWTRRRLVDHWKGKAGSTCLRSVERTCLPLDGREMQRLARQEELADPNQSVRPSQGWLTSQEGRSDGGCVAACAATVADDPRLPGPQTPQHMPGKPH